MKKGDIIFYMGKKGKIIDIDTEDEKRKGITYKIEIYSPFIIRFWVKKTQIHAK